MNVLYNFVKTMSEFDSMNLYSDVTGGFMPTPWTCLGCTGVVILILIILLAAISIVPYVGPKVSGGVKWALGWGIDMMPGDTL